MEKSNKKLDKCYKVGNQYELMAKCEWCRTDIQKANTAGIRDEAKRTNGGDKVIKPVKEDCFPGF
jgi:hypothetical protein